MSKTEQILQENIVRAQIREQAKQEGMSYSEYVKTHPNAVQVMQGRLNRGVIKYTQAQAENMALQLLAKYKLTPLDWRINLVVGWLTSGLDLAQVDQRVYEGSI